MLRIFESIKTLIRPQLSGLIVGAGVVGLVVLLTFAYSVEEYRLLYTGQEHSEVEAVAESLKAKGVPYKIDGYAISVPVGLFPAASGYIDSAGRTQTAVTGFEIFDRSGIFLPESTRRINYSRALSGELARTIGQIDGVKGARVHLVLPEKGIFGNKETGAKTASAAVILSLRTGAAFTAEKAEAVAYLVAASVPELTPDGVTVVDTEGRLLLAGGRALKARIAAIDEKAGEEDGVVSHKTTGFKRADEPRPVLDSAGMAQLWAYIAAAVILLTAGIAIWMMRRRRKAAVQAPLYDEEAAPHANESVGGVGSQYSSRSRDGNTPGGITVTDGVLPRAGAEARAAAQASVAELAAIIDRTPVKVIIDAFKDEHPQVIAVVLSQLSAERAAEMLDGFTQEARADLQARAAGLVNPLQSALRDIVSVLSAKGGVDAAQRL
ncbi:MAG: hypothetical protein A3J24_01810 [Deltaproteobacteria bacterium RIFCSPLOWO2_02_FULL_53_8]|nr:MAG: hypothetical protein A3J24_01810 [Deltaproteobacteria bacterium RIFCSPLOWO2_02_FULL_53_8]